MIVIDYGQRLNEWFCGDEEVVANLSQVVSSSVASRAHALQEAPQTQLPNFGALLIRGRFQIQH